MRYRFTGPQLPSTMGPLTSKAIREQGCMLLPPSVVGPLLSCDGVSVLMASFFRASARIPRPSAIVPPRVVLADFTLAEEFFSGDVSVAAFSSQSRTSTTKVVGSSPVLSRSTCSAADLRSETTAYWAARGKRYSWKPGVEWTDKFNVQPAGLETTQGHQNQF